MKYLIAYSASTGQFKPKNWQVATEKQTLEEAISVYENFVAISENKSTEYCGRPGMKPITQVAIFKYAGGDTFSRKPRRYFDNRDKSDWVITNAAVTGLVNRLNSDYTMNK